MVEFSGGFGPGVNVKLAVNASQLVLDRADAAIKFVRDFLVAKALRGEFQDLRFGSAQ